MGIIGGKLGYFMLQTIAPQGAREDSLDEPVLEEAALTQAFGNDFCSDIWGKLLIDLGCAQDEE